MGIMYQQRMDMISDDIWMDKPPVFHGGNPHPSGDLSGVQRSPPKKTNGGLPQPSTKLYHHPGSPMKPGFMSFW